MSEQELRPQEHGQPVRYEQEKKTEELMRTYLREGLVLRQIPFSDPEMRNQAARAFMNRYTDVFSDTPGIGSLDYEISGPQLYTHNIAFGSDVRPDKKSLTFQLDTQEAYKTLSPFEVYEVRYDRLSILPDKQEDESGGTSYRAVPYILFSKPHLYYLGIQGGGILPPYEVATRMPVFVPCDGQSEVHVQALEKIRSRDKALSSIALGASGRRLTRSLHKLVAALETEGNDYIKLNKPEILRNIAKYSMASQADDDKIASAIHTVIGKNRPVRLVGEVYGHDGASDGSGLAAGSVLDILPSNPATNSNEPTLVLESNQGLKYAPLSQIKHFEF